MTFKCKRCKRDFTYEPFYKFEPWGNHEQYMRWLGNTEEMCYICYANNESDKIIFGYIEKAIIEKDYNYLKYKWGIVPDESGKGLRQMTREEIHQEMNKLSEKPRSLFLIEK